MSHHAYIMHRATKRPLGTDLELLLLDRDLADAGVQLPWTARVDQDEVATLIAFRVINDVLRAA